MSVHYERRGSAALVTIDRPERHNADRRRHRGRAAGRVQRVRQRRRRRDPRPDRGGRGGLLRRRRPEGDRDARRRRARRPARLHPPALSPKPTIAAISGHCLAGGFELALWCDLRVATTTATFGCAERRWGVPLIDGGTQRLPKIVGQGRALDLVLTGRTIDVARGAGDRPGHERRRARHPRRRGARPRRGDRAAPAGHDQQRPPGAAGGPRDWPVEAELGRERLATAHEGAQRFAGRK